MLALQLLLLPVLLPVPCCSLLPVLLPMLMPVLLPVLLPVLPLLNAELLDQRHLQNLWQWTL